MSASLTTHYDPPIIGTTGDQFLSVESSVNFQWIPDAGNSYSADFSGYDWINRQWVYMGTTSPSHATGIVTFEGVSSSEPFQAAPTGGSFSFSGGFQDTIPLWQNSYIPDWAYDPATGVLDPHGPSAAWDSWMHVDFEVSQAMFGTSRWNGNTSDTEYGHWQLVPDIHNVDVFGGVGNDTILGGQGREMLFGGVGNDVIRAGTGDDLLHGGTGNDALYGGIGRQTLMGGVGDDTIWGGSGAQLLTGDDGADLLYAGSGPQTVMGNAGNDTLWGGTGVQMLEGGDGNDIVHAGSGNATLYGGAGRDTFVFSTAESHDLIADFRLGQDMITLPASLGGLKLTQARDLLPYLSSDPHGNAVLTVGSNFGLVLQHVTVRQVTAEPAQIFKLS